MFVQKVFNWIVPLIQNESSTYDDIISETGNNEDCTTEHLEDVDPIPPARNDISFESVTTSIFPFPTEKIVDEAGKSNTASSEISDTEGCRSPDDKRNLPRARTPNTLSTVYSRKENVTPTLSDADLNSIQLPTPKIPDPPPTPSNSFKSESDSPQLLPLCNRLINVKRLVQSNRSTRSIFTQTDKPEKTKFRDPSHPLPVFGSGDSVSSSPFYTAYNVSAAIPKENITKKRSFLDVNSYGELIVLRCNGSPPSHITSQMRHKFILKKRKEANGVEEACVSSHQQHLSSASKKRIVSWNDTRLSAPIVVEYETDKTSDMFQLGRFESSPVDFRVVDVHDASKARNGVSRFACRVIVKRQDDHQARVFAAAFDASGSIFLGEGGLSCIREGKADGFTTNGVLIMHPRSEWREVSVAGFIYPLRSTSVEPSKRPKMEKETNVLQDGTLIDLCGVTLLWRDEAGLANTPGEDGLLEYEAFLKKSAPRCEVVHKSRKSPTTSGDFYEAYVFLSCGHVMSLKVDLDKEGSQGWSCPLCRCVGPIAELSVGKEPGLFMDDEMPTHAFRPCGHVASLKTVKYWAALKVPEHRSILDVFCPFCGQKLDSITKYVELILA